MVVVVACDVASGAATATAAVVIDSAFAAAVALLLLLSSTDDDNVVELAALSAFVAASLFLSSVMVNVKPLESSRSTKYMTPTALSTTPANSH